MKKLAIGGTVLLILVVAASVVFYVVARKAETYLRESRVLESIETLGKGVTNTAPFTPPANGELTADIVMRFAGVQDAMVAKLGGRFQELAAMQECCAVRRPNTESQHPERTAALDSAKEGGVVTRPIAGSVDPVSQRNKESSRRTSRPWRSLRRSRFSDCDPNR